MKRTYTEHYIVVKVKGPLSAVTGEEVNIPSSRVRTVSELHRYLMEKYLDAAKDMGLQEVIENLDSQNLILVNGRDINTIDGLETNISPGDKVVIINYTHGG